MTTQHNTTQHNTTQHNTTQHNTTQHNTTQHKDSILDKFLRLYRLSTVKPFIKRYDKCKLLDIGCGFEAKFLRSIENYIDYGVGIDFKPPEIHTPKLKTVKSVLEKDLPFEDKSFDIVTMLAVLEHITFEIEILKEVKRVLKDNGILILTVPSHTAKPVLEFLAFKLKIIDRLEIEDHKRYYNKNDILNSAKLSGFTLEKHRYFQFGFNNFAILRKN